MQHTNLSCASAVAYAKADAGPTPELILLEERVRGLLDGLESVHARLMNANERAFGVVGAMGRQSDTKIAPQPSGVLPRISNLLDSAGAILVEIRDNVSGLERIV